MSRDFCRIDLSKAPKRELTDAEKIIAASGRHDRPIACVRFQQTDRFNARLIFVLLETAACAKRLPVFRSVDSVSKRLTPLYLPARFHDTSVSRKTPEALGCDPNLIWN